MRAETFCAAIACVLAGCQMQVSDAPPCRPAIPTAATLLRDPAFAPLTFHRRENYDFVRGIGYDVWGDARFEYRTALQFSLVPAPGARNEDDLCVQAVSLKLALPVDGVSGERLRAFTRALARAAELDEERLRVRLAAALEKGEKFHAIEAAGPVRVEGGTLVHPVRGDFFLVSFAWKAP
jgi:hypothetical protein